MSKWRFHSESTPNIFRPHYAGEIKNTAIIGHFGFVFDKDSGREITWSSWRHRLLKARILNCFSFTINRKAGVSKFLRHKERFRKATFSWRIGVNGTPNRRKKAAFSNFSGLVSTGPKYFPTSYHGVVTTWYYVIISIGSHNILPSSFTIIA